VDAASTTAAAVETDNAREAATDKAAVAAEMGPARAFISTVFCTFNVGRPVGTVGLACELCILVCEVDAKDCKMVVALNSCSWRSDDCNRGEVNGCNGCVIGVEECTYVVLGLGSGAGDLGSKYNGLAR
jgi:predicted sugar kinase